MANDVFYKDNQGNYAFDTKVLEVAFKEARKIYKERGFMREMGQGIAPAITTVDMARAWMCEGHPFTCDNLKKFVPMRLKY